MKKWLVRLAVTIVLGLTIVSVYGLGGLAGMYMPERVERSAAFVAPAVVYLMGIGTCGEGPEVLGCGISDPGGRRETPCAEFAGADSARAVLLTFGQSNSANSGEVKYTASADVSNFSFHDGRCYAAEDPLLGPDGVGGAVWGRVGDKLIESGAYRRVLLVPVGVGGTPIERWTPAGDLYPRVRKALEGLEARGIEPTHVLWHQGESDADRGTPPEEYARMFGEIVDALRESGVDAPVYPAAATICGRTFSDELNALQKELPQRFERVRPGPDTDVMLHPRYRHDDCHFSDVGMDRHAELWVDAILAETPSSQPAVDAARAAL